ncbi:MAG: LytR C-terminal domain-containing protein [Ilumatobacteraceae bacterium]
MSDSRDSSGGVPRRVPRNEPAQVAGGLAIVLSVIAVVVGFLILRSISSSGDAVLGGPVATTAVETTVAVDASLTSTTVVIETTTTVAGPVTEGASVIVANANGVSGSAGLSAAGYSVGSPTNASSSIGGRLELTVVYYDAGIPAAQAVAESVAASMGGVSSIAPVQTPAPTQTGSLDGAGVLVMLGLDKAGRTLEELAPAAVTEVEAGTSG